MIILDTHVWLWWLHSPDQLSKAAHKIICKEEQRQGIRVSAISVWEIAVKVQIGKLVLPMDIESWFSAATSYPGLTVEPLYPVDAIESTRLPGTFHKDPADRIIVALSRRYRATLVTCDRKILAYDHVKTVW